MYSKVQKIWTSGELGAGGETLYKGVGVLNGRGEQLRPCTVGGGGARQGRDGESLCFVVQLIMDNGHMGPPSWTERQIPWQI